jgi:hypothetical protein
MIKLKKLLGEGADASKQTLSNEARRHFLEIISTYGSFGPKLKNENDLAQIAETLGAITDAASEFAIKEAGNHFDEVTVKRNMNELNKLSAQFEKIANEAKSLHSQMENLYEDMGHIIGRYYGVSELSEEEVNQRLGIRNEKLVGNQHKLDVDKDGDIGADDLADLRAGEKVNEASLGDKIMRALFYNPEAQVPRKLNTYSWLDAHPASDPNEYKKAVKNMKDVELTNYWDTVRRKKYTFNKNQEFMKKLIKIEMEIRGLKMLPDLGK